MGGAMQLCPQVYDSNLQSPMSADITGHLVPNSAYAFQVGGAVNWHPTGWPNPTGWPPASRLAPLLTARLLAVSSRRASRPK